eukprot:TRINITY_DN4835_c0_g1_i6.p1 TRINITY_DN4835_c0_g1~~TRINITY_DN4835_c0_g1_i6.p1  ORF type:complete len:256 (-),score=27.53 TRINITY_DN4835_c0_g1_i6:49-816(-)
MGERCYSLPPLLPVVQSIRVYETATRIYVVGGNKADTHFKILQIDRTTTDLTLRVENFTYDKQDLKDLLRMIEDGNIRSGGMRELVTNAVALLGFVRFLNGYYLYLIISAQQVGSVGRHKIYTITDVSYIYLPATKPQQYPNEEERYKGLFFGLDLTKDFYFSYTYDLTRTLQHNMNKNNHIFGNYDLMFMWNRFLYKELDDFYKSTGKEFNPWVVPVIHGYFIQTSTFFKISRKLIFLLGKCHLTTYHLIKYTW